MEYYILSFYKPSPLSTSLLTFTPKPTNTTHLSLSLSLSILSHMASNYFLSLLFTFSLITPHSLSSPIFLPLSNHPNTHHHHTHLFHTPRLSPVSFILDLDTPFLSLASSLSNFSSPVPRRSLHCSAAASSYQSGPLDSQFCTVSAGLLVKGVIGVNHRASIIDDFVYVAAPEPSNVLGLGRNRVGVVEQVTHFFGLSKKFSLCLSSSANNGVVLFGDNHLSNSMVYTPILTGRDGSYRINLKSVRVQNKPLQLQQQSTIKFSTISPYTLIKTEIYDELIKAFAAEAEAEATGMVRTKPVGQFKLCYDVIELKKVPVIDLVLQSEMVKWRIYGENSMTKVSEKVMCLGILDGGEELEAEIVLGSQQMEDNLVEFDLGRSMLGFSSLLKEKCSCSQLTSTLLHKHVQSL